MRQVLLTILLALAPVPGFSQGTTLPKLLVESVFQRQEGEIQALDFSNWTMIVEGLRYEVARDVAVYDDGLESAFTYLREGTTCRITYEQSRHGGLRRIVRIIETLPEDQITRN